LIDFYAGNRTIETVTFKETRSYHLTLLAGKIALTSWGKLR
jgi:hypothetical protein